MELGLIDLYHVIFSFTLAHNLFFTLIVLIVLFVAHDLPVSLVLHHLLLQLIKAIFLLDLVLHALDTLVLDVDLFAFISILAFFHTVLTRLVHLLLLLLNGLCNGSLLLQVEFVEIGQVFLVEHLLLLLGHGELILGILITVFLVLILVLLILILLLIFFALTNHLLLIHLVLAVMVATLTIFIHLFILLIDLVGRALHHLLLVHALHHAALVGLVDDHLADWAWSALLHQGLTAVLGREVGRGDVEAIVVLSTDQELSLLVCQMLIWVMACLTQKRNEMLQLLDLVQIVNEGLADLLDKQWSIGNLEFHLLLDLVVALGGLRHLLGGDRFAHLSGSLESGRVADQSW